jgi:hypothetical protein
VPHALGVLTRFHPNALTCRGPLEALPITDTVAHPCEHPHVISDGVVPRPQRTLAAAALVAMVSGIVVALGDIASVPLAIVAAAASAFMVSVVVFGVTAYRDARSSGSTFNKRCVGAFALPSRCCSL